MWLDERLDTIGMSIKDFADAIDANTVTVYSWIQRGELPHRFREVIELERIASALQWDMLDMLRATGYTLITPGIDSLPPEDKTDHIRSQALPERKRLIYRRMRKAALDALDDLDDASLLDSLP